MTIRAIVYTGRNPKHSWPLPIDKLGLPRSYETLITGQSLTKAESARLQQWAQSMRAGSGGASAASAASGNVAPSTAAQGSATPCPPASASLVTAAAPTRAEYVVLVESLAETYGRRLGTHRAEFDRIFAKPGAGSSAAQAGPVLSGAAGASVYASAVAAAANPDDLQVASNLDCHLVGSFPLDRPDRWRTTRKSWQSSRRRGSQLRSFSSFRRASRLPQASTTPRLRGRRWAPCHRRRTSRFPARTRWKSIGL